MNLKTKSILFVSVLLFAVPFLHAHHGLAQFDTTHVVTLQGTVTEFLWINPHALIRADIKDDHGKAANWALELGSLGMLSRHGWSRDTLKSGDRITVFGYRAKDGSPYMSVGRVELANGKSLPGAP